MPEHHKLTREGLALVADKFKALADPTRLAIIQALMDGELSVNAVVSQTGSSQPTVSRHLGILLKAGLVTRRKSWPHYLYSIGDPNVSVMCRAMCDCAERNRAPIFED